MSGRNRKRGNSSGNKQNNSNKKQTQQKSKSQSKSKKKNVDPKVLWGDFDALPSPEGFAISTPDPVAVVNSLGQPPLPGHGPASPHYFKLVYGRATQLASALAMAGQIDDLTPEPLPEPEEDEAMTADSDDEVDGNTITEEDDDALAEDDDSLTEASADEVSENDKSADEGE